MDRILVTGAAGFIGRALVPRLRVKGHEVFEATSASGDVAEDRTWASFPSADAVVHLAGRSFIPDSWNDPGDFIRGNVLGTIGAVEYCRKHGARLVFISSYLYGHPEVLPIAETAPLDAKNPYAFSKKLSEDTCRFYASAFGIGVTILRPFNVFGPGQAEPFLVPFILRQVKAGGPVRVKDLGPKRDYVYVDDVADAVAAAIRVRPDFGIFNIGSGESWSVEELINLIQTMLGTDYPIESRHERRRDEVMDTVADIRKARTDLGWSPAFGLRGGLEDMFSKEIECL